MAIISIIVPFFNASRTIEETLNSIIRQSFLDFECLLINDESGDNSTEIVKRFIANDKRFKLYNQKKKGVVAARNLGLDNCSGRFITFLDADDLWHKDFLKESISIREKYNHPLAITHSSYIRFSVTDESKHLFEIKPPKLVTHQNILNKNFLPLLTIMIDKEIIKDFKFKELRPEDYGLWIDLIYVRRFKSLLINKKLAYYRISNYQRSKNKIRSIFRIYKFFLKIPNTSLIKRNFNIFIWLYFNIIQRITTKKLKCENYKAHIKYLNCKKN